MSCHQRAFLQHSCRCRSRPESQELAPNTGAGTSVREWTLIYDGDCAFCERCVALIERWNRLGRVRAVPFQGEDALVGAAAAPALLRVVPGGTLLAWVFAVPGVSG